MTGPLISLVGPEHTVQVAGVKLLGFDAASGRKLLLTLVFFLVLYLLSKSLRLIAKKVGGARQSIAFWTRQGISLVTFILGIVGFVSVWFDNPARLATGAGLVAAGLAFALQKVITSFAGYFVILRGKTFNVGDRISMGSVRGDVIALNFIQTVIMEMGEPPSVQSEDSRHVGSRAANTPAVLSRSRTPASLKNPFTTTAGISPISGKRCTCHFLIRTTENVLNKSSSKLSSEIPKISQVSQSRNLSA